MAQRAIKRSEFRTNVEQASISAGSHTSSNVSEAHRSCGGEVEPKEAEALKRLLEQCDERMVRQYASV